MAPETRRATRKTSLTEWSLTQLHIAISPAAEEYLKNRERPVALDYIAALG